MRKVLYIVSRAPGESADGLIPAHRTSEEDISVLLIQDAVTLKDIPGDHTYALSDDVAARNVRSSFPVISYHEMLKMIFDADAVVAL